mmetsp:Transcript_26601/g.37060  ORF Transcript_26601/g.37060 Transcript_26601/m.37060 type:complete len:230 (-) Transcript_26601:200-889(-)
MAASGSRAAKLQAQIRENSREISEYFTDLREWERDINEQDSKLESGELKLTKERKQSIEVPPQENGEGINEDSFEEVKKLGNKYYLDGSYEEALSCYTRLTQINPKSEIAYANRGMAYLKLRRYREAESDCTRALKNNPKFLKALHRRAVARKNLGHIRLALKDARQMSQLAPENASAVSLHRQLKMAVRKLDEATKAGELGNDDFNTDPVEIIVVEEDDTSGDEEDGN